MSRVKPEAKLSEHLNKLSQAFRKRIKMTTALEKRNDIDLKFRNEKLEDHLRWDKFKVNRVIVI
jgi:hypothetical protein